CVMYGRQILGGGVLPEDLAIDDLDVLLLGRSEEGARLSTGYETNPANGFVTSPIEPGIWSLGVSPDGGNELVPRREGIVVEAGASVDLGEIDLRPCFRSLGIHVVGARGHPN